MIGRIAAGCKSMAFGVSVSETFSQNNTRMSSQQALEITRDLVAQAKRDGIWARVYVMTAWVCPFEGPTNPHKTTAVAEKIWELDVDELAIADTIGHANPLEVGRLMEEFGAAAGYEQAGRPSARHPGLGLSQCDDRHSSRRAHH